MPFVRRGNGNRVYVGTMAGQRLFQEGFWQISQWIVSSVRGLVVRAESASLPSSPQTPVRKVKQCDVQIPPYLLAVSARRALDMQSTRCHLLPSRADRFTFAALEKISLAAHSTRNSTPTSFFLGHPSRCPLCFRFGTLHPRRRGSLPPRFTGFGARRKVSFLPRSIFHRYRCSILSL